MVRLMDSPSRSGSLKATLLVGIVLYVMLASLSTYSFSQGPNNRNVSVDTRVNITESLPTVLGVFIGDGFGNTSNITLNAGTYKTVYCNASIRDFNGGSTIGNVSATFFRNQTPINTTSPDDNNTHYTNTSCTGHSPAGFFRNFTCSFRVQYYANPGQWICNVTASDNYNFTGANGNASGHNVTNIDALLALNVTTLIDYGDMAVGDISDPQQANVTNIGNININVSVKGYGLNISDGLAMVCEQGNISIQYEKYNVSDGGSVPGAYVNLSSTLTQIPRLTITQQQLDDTQTVNSTYWLLVVPPNPFGVCNGTVVFQAESS